jgi:hypothetical protein
MNLARLSMPGTSSISKRWRSIRLLCSSNYNSRSYNSSSNQREKTPPLPQFKFSNKWLHLPTKQLRLFWSQKIPHHSTTPHRLLSRIINQLNPKKLSLKKNILSPLLLLNKRSLVRNCKKRSLSDRESSRRLRRISDSSRNLRNYRKRLTDRGRLSWKRQLRGSRLKRKRDGWMSWS